MLFRKMYTFDWKFLEKKKNVLPPNSIDFVGSVQILDCKNGVWIGSIHWLAVHGLNSLLLSAVELEREAARHPFLFHLTAPRLPLREGVYFVIPPRSAPAPILGFRRIPRSEYKSSRSLSRAFPWTARSLPLMKKPVDMLHRLYLRPYLPQLYPPGHIIHDDRDGSSEADNDAELFSLDTQIRPYSTIYNFYIHAFPENVVSLNSAGKRSMARRMPEFRRRIFYLFR